MNSSCGDLCEDFGIDMEHIKDWASPGDSSCNAGAAGDMGLIPGLGRSLGGGHSNPLQFSCLENPMDRGALWATGHGVAQSWT